LRKYVQEFKDELKLMDEEEEDDDDEDQNEKDHHHPSRLDE